MKVYRALAITLGILTGLAACGPMNGGNGLFGGGAVPTGKLPTDVRPVHYRLAFDIDPDKDRFSGVSEIDIELLAPKKVIWIHGNQIAASETTFLPAGGTTPVKAQYEQVHKDGVVKLSFERVLAPGKGTLRIAYDAPFDLELMGLYLVEAEGNRYAFSQLEALDGRRVFPGFDEPRFKTPFDVTITGKASDVIATNALAVEKKTLPDGRQRIRHATTPPLPTYLLAFAIGPLDVVEAPPIPANDVRKEALPFRGIAIKGKGDQLGIALEQTPDLLLLLEEYFGSPYPYDKLDIVAVPDFAFGAMENAGLVIFREWLLLLDEDNAPRGQREAFVSVMAHELAHMWFGNLVTTQWWDDIWLNEAFATWMAARATHQYRPEWEHDVRFLNRVQGAIGQDSLASSRRIREPIESSHDVANAFDGITYSKGGGVVAMYENYIGPGKFRDGVKLYMDRHAMTSTTYNDFTKAISEAAGQDIHTHMGTFLNQPGIPLVDVSVQCNGTGPATLGLKQSRYLPVGSEADTNQTWSVPVCVKYEVAGQVKTSCSLFTDRESSMALEGGGCPAWVFPNAEAAGYYRFSLSSEELLKLRDKGVEKLTARELVAMADSLSAAVGNNRMPAADVIPALLPLATHSNRYVAGRPMGILGTARYTLAPEKREAIEKVARETYGPLWKNIQAKPDDYDPEFRADVAGFLAHTAQDPAVRKELAGLGRAYLGWGGDGAIHKDAVPPDMTDVAVVVAAQDGNAQLMGHIVALLGTETDATIRSALLSGLSAITDPQLAQSVRELIFVDSLLRANEKSRVLTGQNGWEENRPATWEWYKANREKINQVVPRGHQDRLIWMAGTFRTEAEAKDAQAFFEPFIDEIEGGPRSLKRVVEGIRLRAAFIEAQHDSCASYFDEKS